MLAFFFASGLNRHLMRIMCHKLGMRNISPNLGPPTETCNEYPACLFEDTQQSGLYAVSARAEFGFFKTLKLKNGQNTRDSCGSLAD
jgi:hypothetical protein